MLGKNNFFMTRLKSETITLIVLPCIKITSHGGIYPQYFLVSAKRTAELAKMQELFLKQKHRKSLNCPFKMVKYAACSKTSDG